MKRVLLVLFAVLCAGVAPAMTAAGAGDGSTPDGRALYEYYCYQCHGYAGDARTVAAGYLSPRPRDFTATSPTALSRAAMLHTLANGRPGTAMKSFSRVLKPRQREAVVDYVRAAFMSGKPVDRRYHTVENGWAGHERHAAAFPFATGEVPLDTAPESLDADQREGRKLFLSACVTCHEGSRRGSGAVTWDPRALSYPRSVETCDGCHESARLLAGRGGELDPATLSRAHGGPVTASGAPASTGQAVFLRNCAFCHGADGSGRNWIGTFLEPHARDLRQPRIAAMPEATLRAVVRDGLPGTSMPAWRDVLSAAELDAVVAHVRGAIGRRSGDSPSTPVGDSRTAGPSGGLEWRRAPVVAAVRGNQGKR